MVINAKQAMDTCTNVPGQHIVAEFIRRGGRNSHLEGLRTEYRSRKNSMRESLHRNLGSRVSSTDPEGGFFLWLTLQGADAQISTSRLFETALAEGVAFIPGPALSAGGKFDDALRLCFASTTPERAEEGIQRLVRAVDKELAGVGGQDKALR
jgi:2-aminoadipate transaminase